MNILRHKKWHVRTKENMARVRKDEAQAESEDKARLERALLAENERRLETLRKKADDRMESMFGRDTITRNPDASVSTETGHVNFFQDLERDERKNLGTGNKDHEEEKRKEQQEWESKMGIQKALGEGTNELDGKKEWYHTAITTRNPVQKKTYVLPSVARLAEEKRIQAEKEAKKKEKEERRERKEKKKRKRKRLSSSSDDGSSSSSEDERRSRKKHKKKKSKKSKRKREHSRGSSEERQEKAEKYLRLAALREERVQRERLEHSRTQQVLHPEQYQAKKAAEPKQKYNSQFNPHLSNR